MLRLISALVFCLISLQIFANETQDIALEKNTALSVLIAQLPNTKLRELPPLIDQLAQTNAPQLKPIFQSLIEGDLYYIKSNKQVVNAVKESSKNYALADILTNAPLTAVTKSKITKIRTNNSIRGQIRDLLAQIDFTDPNKKVRLEAVNQLLTNPNDVGIKLINKLYAQEKNKDVAALMSTVLFVEQLKNGTPTEQLNAVKKLDNSLQPTVKNAMTDLLTQLEEQNNQDELKQALTQSLGMIEQQTTIFQVLENLFFGLSLGSVLLLAAIGLAITFGVMGVINMAHGEMMMLGAYTTYVIQLAFPTLIEYSLLMAIPAAFLVSGLVGIIIERGVIRFLKGRPLETLLATFGISLILQQLVRTVFSPLNRQVAAPEWMSGSLQINPIFSITFNRLYIVIFSLMVFFSLLLILKKSSLGLHVRAVSQNRDMARALSIKSDWVDAITFGLGSGIAGIAGVVLSQLTNVGPNLGQAYIIDSFLVVVFGGVGNLWGTLVAALSLGTFNKVLEPSMGPVLANIIVLVGLVLFIQKRPKGLFPQKGRAAE